MRKALLIARNALVQLARDRKALVMTLLMPLILIGILGASLKGMLSEGTLEPFKVVVVNADRPATLELPPGAPPMAPVHLGQALVDDVLLSDDAREIIITETAANIDDAKQAVLDGKYVAAIYVTPTFSADVLAGRQVSLQLFTDPARSTQAAIVEQIAGTFTQQVTTGNLAARTLGPSGGAAFMSGPGAAAQLPKLVQASSGAKSVQAIQYYAAAMAIMFMLMTALTRAKEILKEREDGTLDRLLITPTSKATVIAGQMLGTVAVLMSQFLILMAGTRLIYGVDWGPLLPAVTLGLAFSIAAGGIGTAAAGIVADSRAADGTVGVVGNICAALSGSMFPLYIFPEPLKLVAKFVPNYWALQGYLDQMAGLGLSYLWLPVTVLGLIGLTTGSLGAWRLAVK